MSPEKLVEVGVGVSRLVQSAGEFVVIFPQSFAANIGCGFGVSESLHFAPSSWFPIGCSATQVGVICALCSSCLWFSENIEQSKCFLLIDGQ